MVEFVDVSTTPFSLTYLVLIMVLQYCYLDPEELIESDSFKVVESFLHDTGRKNIGWNMCHSKYYPMR